jgi:hypothetical protein
LLFCCHSVVLLRVRMRVTACVTTHAGSLLWSTLLRSTFEYGLGDFVYLTALLRALLCR